MENETSNQPTIERTIALAKDRIEILSLPPENAMDRILSTKHPASLVHSFPEEDLYFLIHEVGPEDAMPLLALASSKQLNFIFDQEIWQKDLINMAAVARWFDLMMEADPNRFTKWMMSEKTDLLEFFLYNSIEVVLREHDQDPSDFKDDFFSFDNIFYFRFIDEAPGIDFEQEKEGDDDVLEEKRVETRKQDLVRKLLEHMADEDHKTYQNILLESIHVLPAESQEEAFRRRNIRLAEKGFFPFDESIGIYQPITPAELKQLKRYIKKEKIPREQHIQVPISPFQALRKGNLFTDALEVLNVDERALQIQQEFATLCNQIIVADQKPVRNKEDLNPVVKKACGYINIGLEKLSQEKEEYQNTMNLILTYPISGLFKVGYGCALALKWQAEKWVHKSWFTSRGLPLRFWGEEWLGVLGGLMLKKPLFFDNYQTGELYREFESNEDISTSESVLNDVIATDEVLSLMEVTIPLPFEYGFLSYKNFLLTLWARSYLKISDELIPLTLNEFKKFYANLWLDKSEPGKISNSMKASFVKFLEAKTGLDDIEISRKIGHILENLFGEMESEYGRISKDNLDPRYIQMFLVK